MSRRHIDFSNLVAFLMNLFGTRHCAKHFPGIRVNESLPWSLEVEN